MTYKDAREFIDQSNQYGSKLGLESITELLRRLDNPQEKLKVVHVAGTNGKGSTTAFITSILASEGYRVGRYISPAVFSYRERIQISKAAEVSSILKCSNSEYDRGDIVTEFITEQGICEAIKTIQPICEDMVGEGFCHPTSFEIETAMAILYLSWEKVDFAVIEVGLGGRLDATNVFSKPLCCVITSIGMDHMQYLGNTIEEIAKEKAGIIKQGTVVINGNKDDEVNRVLQTTCKKVGAEHVQADTMEVKIMRSSLEGTSFLYCNQNYAIRMLGDYQVFNAQIAIVTAVALRKRGVSISNQAVINGLLRSSWEGRFEILAKHPYFIIDGAHNEDAAIKLKESLQLYFPKRRIIYIMGVLADKDYSSIVRITAPLAEVIITITPDNNRALASSQLAKEAKQYTKANVIDAGNVEQAVKLAYEEAGSEDVILSFGSLSYLGEMKEYVNQRQGSED